MRSVSVLISSMLLFVFLLIGMPWFARSEDLPKGIPVAITADKLDYDRAEEIYTAVGHVKIEHEGVRLEADKVVLHNKTGEATAEGRVLLQDKGDLTHADKLQININTRFGIMYKGEIFKKKENLHVKGEVIERLAETIYHIEKGIITTCDEDQWYFKANEMNVDMERYVTADGVSFNMLGLPLLYSPYFLFSVKRQSGFLIPVYTNSSLDGFSIQNAFFWAISDYQDMTIDSDYREKTGHGIGLEYRYMNSIESSGQLYAKFWDMFRTSAIRESEFGHETSESRWEFRFQHQEEFAEDLSGRLDINMVSDENYYHDLYKQLDIKAKPYLDSNAFFVERWNTASLYFLGQYSTDLTQSNRNTIQTLPEIRYTLFSEPLPGPLYLNFDGSAVNFTRQEGNGLQRLDFNPNLAAVFGSSGLSLTPRIGARATLYDRQGLDAAIDEPTSRTYAYAELDMNARISRVYGADQEEGIGKIRHSIEPTVSYNYITPFKQDNIPQFDSLDSVVSMNSVTVSVINRLTAHYKDSKDAPDFTNFDLMVLKLSEAYNLSAMGSGTSHPVPAEADLYINAPKLFSMATSILYDTDLGRLTSGSAGANITTKPVQLNVSYAWSPVAIPPSEYLIAGGSLTLGKWVLMTQYSYDLEKRIMTEADYRVRYVAQCWGITISVIHSPGESRFMVMLDLKGLGSGFK